MNMRPVGAELVHADERTDITKLTADFRNFANMPKKVAATHELLTFYYKSANLTSRPQRIVG